MTALVQQQKAEARSQVRARLAVLCAPDVGERSRAIGRRLAAMPEIVVAQCVAGFVSFGTEVQTHELLRQLLADGKQVCVPSFDRSAHHYICSQLNDFDADLAEGRLGILEPKPQAIRPVHTDLPDVWLVPGLAFDEAGNRLGRGKGFYDRLLQEARGVKIALAYDFQLLNGVPAAAHDVRMDFIVTENRTIKCRA